MNKKITGLVVGGVITLAAFGISFGVNATSSAAEKTVPSEHHAMQPDNMGTMMNSQEMQTNCHEMMKSPEMQKTMMEMMQQPEMQSMMKKMISEMNKAEK